MNLKQHVNESIADFIERLKKTNGKLSVQFSNTEYASIVINDMHLRLKEKFVGQVCHDLIVFASREARGDQIIQE